MSPQSNVNLQQADNCVDMNSSQLTASLNHLDCALLLEDSKHNVLFINDSFYHMWHLPAADRLHGINGSELINRLLPLAGNKKSFSSRLTKVSCRRTKATNLEYQLTDGRILTCNYMPVFIKNEFYGHLWQITDIT
ncbi:MAG TPA: hypothetical protein DCP36_20055, partial [Sporomusaceae bacterium]|nr:hypothetical protein [Sporomusaceae bacterium]